MVFKDHVDELVVKSKRRLADSGAVKMVVMGYHDLDNAFNHFAKLERSRDLTPLEHSEIEFITGEIDNQSLRKIVDLFYLTRFGHKELTEHHAKEFIRHLEQLVIEDSLIEMEGEI